VGVVRQRPLAATTNDSIVGGISDVRIANEGEDRIFWGTLGDPLESSRGCLGKVNLDPGSERHRDFLPVGGHRDDRPRWWGVAAAHQCRRYKGHEEGVGMVEHREGFLLWPHGI